MSGQECEVSDGMAIRVAVRRRKSRLVQTLNARVRGRARFKVLPLYRSRRVKRRLEARLLALTGIQAVEASIVTGNLLVVFDSRRSADDLVPLIERALLTRPKPVAGASTLFSGRAVRVASEAASGLKGLAKRYASRPVGVLRAISLITIPLGFLRIFSSGLVNTSPLLVFLTLLIILMGQIIGKKEGWSRANALYFSFVTATTIGYGDLRPTKAWSKVLAVAIGFVGLVFTSIVAATGLAAAQHAFLRAHLLASTPIGRA